MEINFSKKVVLVTGAASGIGRASAIEFAKLGATVIAADVLEDEGLSVVDDIQKFGGKAVYVHADMGNVASVKKMVDFIERQFGRLDVAFNNAGVEGESAFTAESSLENWDRVTNINLRGVWACMKYEIPLMLKNGGGAIVNCSSIAGLIGFKGIPAYDASKHGVVGLTQTAALEYARQGIRVNAVNPGVIKTPMIDRFTGGSEEVEKQFAEAEPMGRLGRPEEIAHVAVWLSSDYASFVTGQAIAVDGGWVAQ